MSRSDIGTVEFKKKHSDEIVSKTQAGYWFSTNGFKHKGIYLTSTASNINEKLRK